MTQSSHAAVQASESPTPAQLKEFFGQIESRRITKDRLQKFLRGGEEASRQPVVIISRKPHKGHNPPISQKSIDYWEKMFPGAGVFVAEEFYLITRDGFELTKRSYHNYPNDAVQQAVFWTENRPDIRFITLTEMEGYVKEGGLDLKRYRGDVEEFLLYQLEDLRGHINFEGDFWRAMQYALENASESVESDCGWSDLDLVSWFWLKLEDQIGFDLTEDIQAIFGDVISDNWWTAFFAALAGKFLGSKCEYGSECLLSLWRDGNWPIGFDSDGKLVVLCA